MYVDLALCVYGEYEPVSAERGMTDRRHCSPTFPLLPYDAAAFPIENRKRCIDNMPCIKTVNLSKDLFYLNGTFKYGPLVLSLAITYKAVGNSHDSINFTRVLELKILPNYTTRKPSSSLPVLLLT